MPWRIAKFALLAAALTLTPASTAPAAVFDVNTELDNTPDGVCDAAPGDCTVREAVIGANATATVDDTINLPNGSYSLTINGTGEDAAATGDLDVDDTSNKLTIVGEHARMTRINAGGIDRVLDVRSGTLELRNATILGGVAPQEGMITPRGGGIRSQATLIVVDSALSGNSAPPPMPGDPTFGGGIFSSGTLTLTRVTIANNTNTHFGGGVFKTGTATVTNTTISGNQSISIGGGFYSNGGTATLTNTTVAMNQAGGALGGGLLGGVVVSPRNTIVAGNSPDQCSGTVDSQGNNLSTDGTCALDQPSDKPNGNPALAPLANNGGPTDTHAIGAASEAVNAGNPAACPPTDQRGVARVGPCDIGAFESPFAPPPPPPPPPDGASPPSNAFSFGKAKRNKKKGTAKLPVEVPGPGELYLAGTKKVKGTMARADAAGTEVLRIRPKGKAKRRLNGSGKAKVTLEVTFTPDGGALNTETTSLKLSKRTTE